MKTLFLSLLLLLAAGTSACAQENKSPVNNTPMTQEERPDNPAKETFIIDGPTQQVIPSQESPSHVLERAEQMPQFPGGDEVLYQFIRENLVYPKKAIKDSIQGTVVLRFAVEEDGSIGVVQVLRGISPELDQEAVRLVKVLPRFIPGTQNGRPIAVWFTLPVRFRLDDRDIQEKTPKTSMADFGDHYERIPEFPGGNAALYQFIRENLVYPEEVLRDSIEGVVMVRVLVKEDGTIGETQALNEVNEYLIREALRLASILPRFIPGSKKGVPTPFWYYFPVHFSQPDWGRAPKHFGNSYRNPMFPGGDAALYKFIKENLVYPEKGITHGIQGTVILRFMVRVDGSIGQIQILRGVNEEFDREALRLVSIFPRFIPGMDHGVTVPAWFTHSIKFKLE